jgi:hypothetical protein
MISVRDDHTIKEDLQAGGAWGDLEAESADEIDRAMCAAEGLAALQRAADLVAIFDTGEHGAIQISRTKEQLEIVVTDDCDPAHVRLYVGDGALEAAAAWCRQRGGA